MNIRSWEKFKTTIGNLFIDLGKLSFGGLILGSILRGGLDPFQTFIFGAAIAIVFFVVGIFLLISNKE